MFNNKRRGGVHMPKHHSQPVQSSAAAATAATTAFNKNADTGLSSAAAAAALRSHPSPTPRLADLQTKRLQRRLSNGSDVSRASAMTTGHMQGFTSPSRMSLTDRTLRGRSPSPAGRKPLESPRNVPPIPAIPAQMMKSNAGRQRAASLESSARPAVQPQSRTNRRPDSVYFGESKLDRLKQSTLAQSASSSVTQETPRESARQQVNFSRPMSPQNSPRGRPLTADSPQNGHGGWFGGPVVKNSRVRHNVESVRDVVQDQLPVSKAPPLIATEPQSHKFKKLLASTTGSTKQKDNSWKPTVVGAHALESSRWSSAPAITPTATAPSAPSSPVPTVAQSVRPTKAVQGTLARTEATTATRSEGFSVDHRIAPIISQPRSTQATEQAHSSPVSLSTQTPDAVAKPAITIAAINEGRLEQSGTEEASSATLQRRHSLSPHRVPETDVFTGGSLHHPLGRSASPFKSALKIRQPGLSRTVSNPPNGSITREDNGLGSSPNRKKSVRINLEVKPGEDAGGLGGSKYAPPTPVKVKSTFEDDMTGIMQPRAALPSFSSVRGQRRELEGASGDERGDQRTYLDASRHSDSSHESPRQSLLAGKGTRREDTEVARSKASAGEKAAFVQDTTPNEEQLAEKSAATSTAFERPVSTAPATSAQAHSLPASSVDTGIDSDDELESSDDGSVYEDASEELENYEFASLDQILEEPTPEPVDMPNGYMDKAIKAPMLRQESGDTLALERRLEEARVNSIGRAQELQPDPAPEVAVRSKGPENRSKTARTTSPVSETKSKTEMPRTLRTSKWSPVNSSQQQLQSTLRDSNKRFSHASPTRQSRQTSAVPAATQFSPSQPMLTRKDSSDSVSSFKRSRRNPRTQEGRYSLRQSMRSASVDRFEPVQRGRPERRPQSPPNSSTEYKMRPSMRTRMSDTAVPTKNESTWKRLTSPARFTSKLRPNKNRDSKSNKPHFGRRFSGSFAGSSVADSDDDMARRTFVSRFADSDDDDVALPQLRDRPVTPILGMPRSTLRNDDDSTDLEDSDDERMPAVHPPVPTAKEVEQAHAPVKSVESPQPRPTTAAIDGLASSRFASTRPTHKRWSSFLGVGSHKHKITQQSNASTPTLLNTPVQDSSARTKLAVLDSPGRIKGKLRRKPRHVSEPLEDAPQWPLKDESPKTNGYSVTLPFLKRKESDRPSVPTRHPDHVAPAEALADNKEIHISTETNGVEPRTNGAKDLPLVTDLRENHHEKEESKSRFGKFKRMMKMSKKQPGNGGAF